MLLCPGNVVGGARRQPTTLPGHGSTFMQLPRRRRGGGGDRVWAWVSVQVYGVCTWAYIAGSGVVARAQENH